MKHLPTRVAQASPVFCGLMLSLLTPFATAQEFYVGINYGALDIDEDTFLDNLTGAGSSMHTQNSQSILEGRHGFGILGGMKFGDLFNAELSYANLDKQKFYFDRTTALASPLPSISGYTINANVTRKSQAAGIDLVKDFSINKFVSLTASVGTRYVETEIDLTINRASNLPPTLIAVPRDESDTEFVPTASIGATLHFYDDWQGRVEFRYMNEFGDNFGPDGYNPVENLETGTTELKGLWFTVFKGF